MSDKPPILDYATPEPPQEVRWEGEDSMRGQFVLMAFLFSAFSLVALFITKYHTMGNLAIMAVLSLGCGAAVHFLWKPVEAWIQMHWKNHER